MRILWLSNKLLTASDDGSTGGWLDAMAAGLAGSGQITLANITQGTVIRPIRRDFDGLKQLVVPTGKLDRRGLPSRHVINAIQKFAQEFKPDLVHVWGTELYWGLLTARGIVAFQDLLETQGIRFAIARVFYGGLTRRERLACLGFKELLKRNWLARQAKAFSDWEIFEREMIRGHRFIATQSAWAAAQVKAVNPHAQIIEANVALRSSFYDSGGWSPQSNNVIFCGAAYPSPFKGLHVAIRALALLRRRVPSVRMHIAGAHQRSGLRRDGYISWLNRLIQHLQLEASVIWLGPLSATQMVAELKGASVALFPTFIENCCTGMQEAMAVGTPVVASFVGGIPTLAQDEKSCLFFTPGDEPMCAYQLERLLTNRALAQRLSREAQHIARLRNNREAIFEAQLNVYRQISQVDRPARRDTWATKFS